MTLTVNGLPAEPGCYVEGHWGQYGGGRLIEQALGFGGGTDDFERRLRKLQAEYIEAREADSEHEHEIIDDVESLLNEVTEGGYWEWYDGEVFLRSYVCPECGRDATTLRQALSGLLPVGMSAPRPCDHCCDADDPGCFA